MAKKKQPSGPRPALTPTPNGVASRAEAVGRPTAPRAEVRSTATQPRPVSSRPAAVRSTTPTPTPGLNTDLPIDRRPVSWWPPVILALVAFALYINTFGHGYALDDIAAIGQNLFVKQGLKGIPDLLRTEFWHFSNISLGYYRPLSLITFAVEQEYFKDNPHISHVINAILYGCTGLAVGILLQKWFSGQTIMAFLIGLLFIAHPLHTEIVANIKGRDELMSFLFITLMLICNWQYLETKAWGWLVGAGLALYLAFLSKESAVVSLALIPAMQYWFARRNVWRSLASLWPSLIVAAIFFYQKVKMIGSLSGKPPVDWANYPYAIEKTQGATTFKFLMYYLKLLFFPHPLVYDYSYNVIPSGRGGDVLVWMGFLAFLALVWLAWIGFRRRTTWGFALFWFWVTMVPPLGFIFSRGGILAERFLYMPVMAFSIIAVWGMQKLLVKQTAEGATSKPMLVRYAPLLALLAVVAGLYSFKTVDRNKAWKNNFVLFNTDLKYAPTSCQVQRHVANEWIEKGLKDRSKIDTLQRKLVPTLKPDSIKLVQKDIEYHVGEANKYGRLAIQHLQNSVSIYPSFGEAYFSMAYVFQKIIPNRDSAVHYYKQTIRAASSYAPAYNNLGVIYQSEGKFDLASYYYNQSMIVNPAYQDGKNNWANLKKQLNIDVKTLPENVLSAN